MKEDHIDRQHVIWNFNVKDHVDRWYITGNITIEDHDDRHYVTNITVMQQQPRDSRPIGELNLTDR